MRLHIYLSILTKCFWKDFLAHCLHWSFNPPKAASIHSRQIENVIYLQYENVVYLFIHFCIYLLLDVALLFCVCVNMCVFVLAFRCGQQWKVFFLSEALLPVPCLGLLIVLKGLICYLLHCLNMHGDFLPS